jgi:hypothetical protein
VSSPETFGFAETAEELRFIVNSPAWTDFFVPVMQEAREMSIQHLLDPSEERKARLPDDYLRAKVHLIDALLVLGHNVVAEEDAKNQNQLLQEQTALGYAERAEAGSFGPLP